MIGATKSVQTLSVQSFSRTLRVMDVHAENRRRLTKKWVCCGPSDGEKLLDPWASARKGQACPQKFGSQSLYLCCLSSLR